MDVMGGEVLSLTWNFDEVLPRQNVNRMRALSLRNFKPVSNPVSPQE